ncbi:hypothetical protein IWX49DRAFT_361086 [Phyllosticta citricarpa]|uniref:Uncharacterized protein n=2 Tax=Phyllosticta TaxID=121621 RepID=A0ABR1MJG2_9PEZI
MSDDAFRGCLTGECLVASMEGCDGICVLEACKRWLAGFAASLTATLKPPTHRPYLYRHVRPHTCLSAQSTHRPPYSFILLQHTHTHTLLHHSAFILDRPARQPGYTEAEVWRYISTTNKLNLKTSCGLVCQSRGKGQHGVDGKTSQMYSTRVACLFSPLSTVTSRIKRDKDAAGQQPEARQLHRPTSTIPLFPFPSSTTRKIQRLRRGVETQVT